MSLSLAQKNAWSLAKSLMVCITVFEAGSGYGVMPSTEFDGDLSDVVHDLDPFERCGSSALAGPQARYGGFSALCFRPAVVRLYFTGSAKVVVAALRTSHV